MGDLPRPEGPPQLWDVSVVDDLDSYFLEDVVSWEFTPEWFFVGFADGAKRAFRMGSRSKAVVHLTPAAPKRSSWAAVVEKVPW